MRNMKTLQNFRDEIDAIDAKLIDLLAQRFACSTSIADIKKETGMPVFDRSREEFLFARIEKIAKEKGVPAKIAKELFHEIVHQSRRVQEIRKSST